MAKHTTVCAGIDTGKRKLDVAIDGRAEQLQVNNTADGHQTLVDWLRQHRVKRIGIASTPRVCDGCQTEGPTIS